MKEILPPIRIDSFLKGKIVSEAEKRGLSISGLVRMWLIEKLTEIKIEKQRSK